MAKVVSFINYKGGVGKTTTAYHVACSLAQHYDQRVLMIDIDPQTNLTFLCLRYDDWKRRKKNSGTIKDLYDRYVQRQALDVRRFTWSDTVVVGRSPLRHPISGLDLIPCDIDLLGEDVGSSQIVGTFRTLEALRQNAQQYLREVGFLRRVIRETEERYDWIVIDCPPNLYLMTQNALHASDYYVVTAIPDHLSTIGLNILTSKVRQIGNRISEVAAVAGQPDAHPVAELGAIVFVKVRIGGDMLTIVHADTKSRVSSDPDYPDFHGKVVETHTTDLIGYSEAASADPPVPVWEHDSTNARRAARKNEYPEITRELMARLL